MASDNELTVIGRTNFHNENKKFGIKLDDRRRHVYIMGKTGMGKTSLLLNMAVSDIQKGHGMAFVDPHGDVAESLLHYIPEDRVDDVIYFNPADLEYPIGFNPLDNVNPEERHIVTDGLIGVFQKIWADSWGPRLAYILRNCILTLLEYPDTTLLDIMRILVDKNWRSQVVRHIQDPVVKSFWINEFNNYTEQMMREAISPIQNKVGQFTSSPLIRNIIGQKKSTIDLRDVMDNRKILLLNLSKGAIGEGGSQLIGAMMITKMQLAAMSRVNIPEKERVDFFAYIDEFQNFSTDSFAEILSEARKYRLGLILAHQYIHQLSENVQAAVFGNVGTTILFRVGGHDSEVMEKEFGPRLTAQDLVNLPKWKIYVKLMIDGATSQPFSANTIPDPEPPDPDLSEHVIEHSRTTYGTHRDLVGGSKADEDTAESSEASQETRSGSKTRSQNSSANSASNQDFSASSESSNTSRKKNRHKPSNSSNTASTKSQPQASSSSSSESQTASEAASEVPSEESSPAEASQLPEEPDRSDDRKAEDRPQSSEMESPAESSEPREEEAETPLRDTEEESTEEAPVYNPLLAKKIKEMYAKSTTPLGDTEYVLKAQVQEQLNEPSENRFTYSELLEELLLEIKPDLDWATLAAKHAEESESVTESDDSADTTEDAAEAPPEREYTSVSDSSSDSESEPEAASSGEQTAKGEVAADSEAPAESPPTEEPVEIADDQSPTAVEEVEEPEDDPVESEHAPATEKDTSDTGSAEELVTEPDISSKRNVTSQSTDSVARGHRSRKRVIKPGQVIKFKK